MLTISLIKLDFSPGKLLGVYFFPKIKEVRAEWEEPGKIKRR
ncbi:hypothetical protein CWATWH8502_552 [Crocosphaera watsonii WH 8502]|uniref:Uncharacterized protein n=5 Tax=Crocosphaera watsonii TaxID=263511 RepID=T2JKW8_CROWT|nr:hypothetical protein CWATWH0003_5095 [Crocosphaera watsonii WH 0003]CCQ53345.1 hypothetical protein CWATWH8502_552 [Crocosphaera watsonii WH 8502]CCQ56550.1 hypothetical protein CWATWH0005_1969 [Crocosphaera watsonii WH 0005]CCQ60716.1 hypothetical protein CWATWH0401_3630 [Crocosphaera watsonii WH 0401]CCQ65709.1 hypothetical protein CWATWH0402_1709 [Crocosphaera watsonii WH 0402]